MATTAERMGDAIQRACVNLKAVRNNLPEKFVFQEGLYTQYNYALAELAEAGVDVREWRLPPNASGNIHAKEFGAKIDAILMYFTIRQEKTAIGFRR